MQLVTLLLTVGLLGGFIALVGWLVTRINRQAEARYGIRPISWGRAFLMVVPYFVLGLGCFLDAVRNNHNFIVAVGFAVLVTVGVFWWIATKTNVSTALASVPLLALLGLSLATFILLIVFLVVGGSGNDHQQRNAS